MNHFMRYDESADLSANVNELQAQPGVQAGDIQGSLGHQNIGSAGKRATGYAAKQLSQGQFDVQPAVRILAQNLQQILANDPEPAGVQDKMEKIAWGLYNAVKRNRVQMQQPGQQQQWKKVIFSVWV